MKKIMTAVLLILIIAGTAPIINGLLVEKTIRNVFTEANSVYAENNLDLSLEIIRYDRNLFSSDIEWKINFGSFKAMYGIEEMIFSEHAKHGYTGVVSTTNFEKNIWFQSFIDEKLQGHNPFHIRTSYSFFGDIEATFSSDRFSITLEDSIVEVQPGEFAIATDSELRHFTSSGKWQGLNASDKITMSEISMGEIFMESEMEKITSFIWDGFLQFTAQDFTAQQPRGSLSCDRIEAKYTLDHDGKRGIVSGRTRIDIAGLGAGNQRIDKASAVLAVNGMNAQGYEDFMKTYTKIISEVMAGLQNDPEQAGKTMEEQMGNVGIQLIAAYEKLLKKDLELQVSDLHIELSQGDIRADVTLRLLRDMTLMQFAPIVGQPDLALGILYLKSDISLPVELVGEPPLLLLPSYPGMETGLFVKEGDMLKHSAETRDGTLFLNGKEFVLSQP
jgi:uncharacterized protein YdgA (DUF945 family)